MTPPKMLTFKLVRSFGLGFKILSPKYNGLCVELDLACFSVMLWSRGRPGVEFVSYWC